MTETAQDTYLLSVDLCSCSSVGRFLEVVAKEKETGDLCVSVTFHLGWLLLLHSALFKRKKKSHLLGTND